MLRKARLKDIARIHRLINACAGKGEMLPRPLAELYDNMRDYFVYEDEKTGEVQGACALHICWEDLAEVRSLCVVEDARRKGLGGELVRACIDEARSMDVKGLFVLTRRSELFGRFGFKEVDKSELPQKIWTDCINCPKFPLCDEAAMIAHLT